MEKNTKKYKNRFELQRAALERIKAAKIDRKKGKENSVLIYQPPTNDNCLGVERRSKRKLDFEGNESLCKSKKLNVESQMPSAQDTDRNQLKNSSGWIQIKYKVTNKDGALSENLYESSHAARESSIASVMSHPINMLVNDAKSCTEQSVKYCQYPPYGPGSVSITNVDYNCLEAGKFLNDVIIDFYLKHLQLTKFKSVPEVMDRTHIFSTYFYQRLTTRKERKEGKSHPIEDNPKLTAAEKRFERVKKWTKNVNLFDKDFIVVPINENKHWYLCIICLNGQSCKSNAGHRSRNRDNQEVNKSPIVLKATDLDKDEISLVLEENVLERDEVEVLEEDMGEEESEEVCCKKKEDVTSVKVPAQQPCILTFDSLSDGDNKALTHQILREYLTCEWKAKMVPTGLEERIFTRDNMVGSYPKVQQQPNSTDCGVYLLQYVESFFKDPYAEYCLSVASVDNWFAKRDVEGKRNQIAMLIKELSKEQNPGIEHRLPELNFFNHVHANDCPGDNDVGNKTRQKLGASVSRHLSFSDKTENVCLINDNSTTSLGAEGVFGLSREISFEGQLSKQNILSIFDDDSNDSRRKVEVTTEIFEGGNHQELSFSKSVVVDEVVFDDVQWASSQGMKMKKHGDVSLDAISNDEVNISSMPDDSVLRKSSLSEKTKNCNIDVSTFCTEVKEGLSGVSRELVSKRDVVTTFEFNELPQEVEETTGTKDDINQQETQLVGFDKDAGVDEKKWPSNTELMAESRSPDIMAVASNADNVDHLVEFYTGNKDFIVFCGERGQKVWSKPLRTVFFLAPDSKSLCFRFTKLASFHDIIPELRNRWKETNFEEFLLTYKGAIVKSTSLVSEYPENAAFICFNKDIDERFMHDGTHSGI